MKPIKIRFLRVILLSLALAAILSGTACGSSTEEPTGKTTGENVTEHPTAAESGTEAGTTEGEKTMKTYDLKDVAGSVKVIGRSSLTADGITCDWSASGISFCAECRGKVTMTLFSSQPAYFTVLLDGVRQTERLLVMSGETTVTLAENLTDDEHLITVLKQTELTNAMCVLRSLTFDGVLAKRPSDKKLYFEFYGDSITSGYGNLAEKSDVTDPGSALWQDGTQTYAFRIAETLGADWSMVSVSGIPFSKGYTTFTMGEIMEKTNWKRGDAAYDFARKPDLVIINLGTNDAQCGADLTRVKEAVGSMISLLKQKYGKDQKILFVTCMMNTNCRTEILGAITDAGGTEQGIYEVCTYESNRFGANGHPNMTAHIDVAEEVVRFIRKSIFGEKT